MSSIANANEQFYAALNANLTGDTAPIQAVWSVAHDITNCGPFGGRHAGRAAVLAQFDQESQLGLKSKVEPVEIHLATGLDMGYVSCVETFRFTTAGAISSKAGIVPPTCSAARLTGGSSCTIIPI